MAVEHPCGWRGSPGSPGLRGAEVGYDGDEKLKKTFFLSFLGSAKTCINLITSIYFALAYPFSLVKSPALVPQFRISCVSEISTERLILAGGKGH